MSLLSPSGGLVYHARALRYGKRQWAPFRAEVGAWLSGWTPPSDKLLIVGPSAGYSLPTAWLRRFSQVDAIDLDPLAKPLFRRRHPGVKLGTWARIDAFPITPEGIDWRPFRAMLMDRPGYAVLFANVLGQITVSVDTDELVHRVERDLVSLRLALSNRHWASYHDRLSSMARPEIVPHLQHHSDAELIDLAYPGAHAIVTHGTGLFGAGLPCRTFAWECTKGYYHLIEGCVGRPKAAQVMVQAPVGESALSG